ncbi:uncharacterized protein LOC112574888 isoform X2 [Pomacea canaliculata]|uniref:uncharacterized protein LOC112574888 isoform X2 n=1 Tax=Pomacea canaliculata TaxID=400727 RepID=UPI000D73E889|nr:uncharacterized protein LOC112574888 isoform X2 [Pomacea canaliculata]
MPTTVPPVTPGRPPVPTAPTAAMTRPACNNWRQLSSGTPLNMKGYLLVSLLYFISLLKASLQNTCYLPQCQHGMLLQDCILGQWQCRSNEFCEVRIHDHVSTQCTGQEHLLQCIAKQATNAHSCDPMAPSSADCTYCCNDETCMQQLVTAPVKHCFTNQCGDHFVDLTDCLGHTWNCDSDEYCEMITHQADFPSQCNHFSHLEGESRRWQMQCLPIHSTRSNGNGNGNGNHIGYDTCRDLSKECTPGCDPNSHAHNCILCATSFEDFESQVRNTTSSLPSTVSSTGQPAQSPTSSTGQPAQSTVSSQPSTAGGLSTVITTTTTTAASSTATCVQCGDYDKNVPCTDEETLDDTQTPCTGGGAYCMTHALVDSAKTTSIYKRCVNETICRTMWYEQTSDNPICLNFDLNGVTSDLACHFCCHRDGCNVNILPAQDTLFIPIG